MKLDPNYPEVPAEAISRTYYSSVKKPIFEKFSDLLFIAGGTFILFVGMAYYQTGTLTLSQLLLEAGGAILIAVLLFWWQFRRNKTQIAITAITLNMYSVSIKTPTEKNEFPLAEAMFTRLDDQSGEHGSSLSILRDDVVQVQISKTHFVDFQALHDDLIAFGIMSK